MAAILSQPRCVIPLGPEQNDWHFYWQNFNYIFLNENLNIFIKSWSFCSGPNMFTVESKNVQINNLGRPFLSKRAYIILIGITKLMLSYF